MAFDKAHQDLIDIAESCLSKVLARMKSKSKPLAGKRLENMKRIETALRNIEIVRIS